MWDEIADFFTDAWDYIWDFLVYLFTFEWFGDVGDFFSTMFEGFWELSIFGIFFGIVGTATVYLARNYMLYPFLVHFSPVMAIVWGAVTYIGTFIAGYMVGKYFENSG